MLPGHWLRPITIAVLLAAVFAPASGLAQEALELQITSSRYIVIDAATGNVFAQRDADKQVPIASLTKIFTAVQAMEMAPLDTRIVTKDSDMRAPGGSYFAVNGTVMGFSAGEEYTLEEMLYGMLLPSGNDAANAIARSLGHRQGDTDEQAVQRFLDLMNQRVADMGLTDTHLMNAHGWGVGGHYSTAADVAAFGRLVTNYPKIMEIMGTRTYTTSNGDLTFNNSNRSLTQYPSVIAGKTGYDWDAGYCLINFAVRGSDAEIISVTLEGVGPGDWYDDNATLLDYGFDRESELVASGQDFDGDVVTFSNPAVSEIARSTDSSGAFVEVAPLSEAGAQFPVAAAPAAVTPTEDSGTDRIPSPAVWVSILTVSAVLALRGFGFLGARGNVRGRRSAPGSDERHASPNG